MKKLTPKASDFLPGKKIFLRGPDDYEISESEPEEFLFGADIPEEEGSYVLSSAYGSFLIVVKEGEASIYPYNYWASRTGSGNDGEYIYANNDFTGDESSSGTLLRSVDIGAINKFGDYYDSLVDWGEFLTLSPIFSTSLGLDGGGFVKINKDTWEATEVLHEADFVDFYYAASVDLGGFIFISNDFTLIHINAYDGTVTTYDTEPQTSTLGWISYVIDLGNGYIAATRENANGNAYIYRFHEGSFSYIGERVWYTGDPNSSGVAFAWSHLFQIHRDTDSSSLYLYDDASGFRVRKIDLDTFELEWQFDFPLNLPYQDVFLVPLGTYIETYLDKYSGDFFLAAAKREVFPSGPTSPGVIRLNKETGEISNFIPAPDGITNPYYFIRRISEENIVIFSSHNTSTIIIQNKDSGALVNTFVVDPFVEFSFYERYTKTLPGNIYALATDRDMYRVNESGSTLMSIPNNLTANLGFTCYPIISDGNMIVADYGTTVTINEISFN